MFCQFLAGVEVVRVRESSRTEKLLESPMNEIESSNSEVLKFVHVYINYYQNAYFIISITKWKTEKISHQLPQYLKKEDKYITGTIYGLTPCIACLSPIPINNSVSCVESSRLSTAVPRACMMILIWLLTRVSLKTHFPSLFCVIRLLNSLFS